MFTLHCIAVYCVYTPYILPISKAPCTLVCYQSNIEDPCVTHFFTKMYSNQNIVTHIHEKKSYTCPLKKCILLFIALELYFSWRNEIILSELKLSCFFNYSSLKKTESDVPTQYSRSLNIFYKEI